MRLLLVEDEKRMAELLKKGLEEEGYAVTLAGTGNLGYELARNGEFETILLDVMLPGMDGYQVAKRLRDERVATPILMLTARDATPDIVQGLDGGADDYLTKPFAFEVLLARIRALARRGVTSMGPVLEIGPLRLDPATREVVRAGERITLTRTEFQLLEYLMRRPGQVVPRTTLIEAVWGFERDIEGNTLDAFVRLLRAKVEREGSRLIQTVRGVGYTIRHEEVA